MIADMVEAAGKALPDPNPKRIEGLVQRLIAKKREDGQFDDCDMTLRELALVERALTHALIGMHHTRPAYLPAPKRNDRATMLATARAMRQNTDGDASADDAVLQTMRMSKMGLEPTDSKPAGAAQVDAEDGESPPPLTGDARPSSPTAVVASEQRKNTDPSAG